MRAIFAFAAAALLLASCATVQGVGRDIESIGKAGEEIID